MASFGGLGIGLCLVFGCLLLALVAEVYYLIWWRKRRVISNTEAGEEEQVENFYRSNHAKDYFLHLICWRKKPSSLQTTNSTQESVKNPEAINGQEPDLELGTNKDMVFKGFGEDSVEAELMNLHNLAGPPRFLFTIREETKEDLESDDGKSRCDRSRKGSRTRSLSDILVAVDSPFLGTTPLASPRLKSPPLDTYFCHGFNPLFESSFEAELNRFKSSPPPTFKFLRDAEEKLLRKLMEEAEKRASSNIKNSSVVPVQDSVDTVKSPNNSTTITEETEGSFLGFIVGKNRERAGFPHPNLPQFPSSSSQVLPLVSSPTTFRPVEETTPPCASH